MAGGQIDSILAQRVREVLEKHARGDPPEAEGLIATDSLGEVIEKLIILHIRTWMLEDRAQALYDDDARLADLKRKIDSCFKVKRPQLVEAVNRLIDAAIRDNRSLIEDNVKLYDALPES